ncbi:hypothetical protein [Streptomyces sp. NL15-2K]|uniref:hypothetical protein n=1 Tax=Streptomyces sp. NL15-2K TaxID=376149 RepID=UPI0026F0E4EC|nr:hypothetical protein [Kutzneria buriramensis]WKX15979.1 hypothetical protein Q4V64_54285 [Kutzneria buriramensis]
MRAASPASQDARRGTAISASSTGNCRHRLPAVHHWAASTQPVAPSTAAVTDRHRTAVRTTTAHPAQRWRHGTRSAGRNAGGAPPQPGPGRAAVRAGLPCGSAGSASAFT